MDTVSWAIERAALPERGVYSDFRYTCDGFRLRSRWPPPTAHVKDFGGLHHHYCRVNSWYTRAHGVHVLSSMQFCTDRAWRPTDSGKRVV